MFGVLRNTAMGNFWIVDGYEPDDFIIGEVFNGLGGQDWQRISYGLCQVMLAVAREYGFGGWPCELCRPETGLKYGAMHLAAKMRQAGGDTTKALLLYNGGGDKAYPAKVLAWAELIETAMQLKGV